MLFQFIKLLVATLDKLIKIDRLSAAETAATASAAARNAGKVDEKPDRRNQGHFVLRVTVKIYNGSLPRNNSAFRPAYNGRDPVDTCHVDMGRIRVDAL